MALRPPAEGDAERLIAARDEEFHRWLGPGAADPRPTFCVLVGGEVVGWVDAGDEHDWLAPGERNLGYFVAAGHRGLGIATRALRLLVSHLGSQPAVTTGVLLIDHGNGRSLAVAERAGFTRVADVELDGRPSTRWERRLREPQLDAGREGV